MLLFHLLQTIIIVFFNTYNHISLYSPTASGTRVDPNSQVCLPSMLVLPTVYN
jgi:hypothetical protein